MIGISKRSITGMSIIMLLALLVIVAVVACSSNSREQITILKAKKLKSAEWRQVSSFEFDWDRRGTALVTLEIPSEWNDPGDFTRIRIHMPERNDFVLNEPNGWVKYDSEDASLSPELRLMNLIRSDYVLAIKAEQNRTVLILFGYSYASSPGSLDVLEVSNDGLPIVVLHRDEFGLIDLRDLDGDGLAEIVGYPCLSQEYGNGLLTYDPLNVYKLYVTPKLSAKLSLPLSKKYNLEHYYGWAGPECSEELAVVLHPPNGGQPVILPSNQAREMMESKHQR